VKVNLDSLNRLKAVLAIQDDMTLPEKTRAEHRAGRNRLTRLLRESVVEEGYKVLCNKFGKNLQGAEALGRGGEWIARVCVRCADGKTMAFEDPLMEFPSDMMITQLALVT
jgi:hypothetical protein